MPNAPAQSKPALPILIVQARQALLLNQEELADRVGSSTRTVQRWEVGRSAPAPFHIHALADAARALDPALAAQLDAFAPRAPAKAADPAPAPALAPSTPVLVDAIVCAAAEAMGVSPQAVRPALLAAFARARDVGLDADSVAAVLAPPEPAAKAKGAKRGR
jgi:DNA-binding XRE family transcriptional regulator